MKFLKEIVHVMLYTLLHKRRKIFINNPYDYINSNITGFQNIENCRKFNIKHLLYASSSSVYGLNEKHPFSENHITDRPANLYGATKKSNELVAFSYSNLYSLPTTGLRFLQFMVLGDDQIWHISNLQKI